jgi:hypothetical protein
MNKINDMMRRARGRRRRGVRAICLAGICAGLAGTASLLIATSGAASGTQATIPHGKMTRLQTEQAQLVREKAAHRAKPSYAAGLRAAQAANPATVQEHRASIMAMHQGPFSPSSFEVRNVYPGAADGTWLLVYAGATTSSSGATAGGALNVYAEAQAGGSLTPVGTFRAPAGTGALTVIAASDDTLTLRTATGKELTFNLATRKYAS